MTIAIGSWFVSTLWLVLAGMLVGLLLGAKFAFRYWHATAVPDRRRLARAWAIFLLVGAVGSAGGMLLGNVLGAAAPTLPQAQYMTPDGKSLTIGGVEQAPGLQTQPSEQTSQASPSLQASGASAASVVSRHMTVVNLWASWCGPCRREMPAFTHAQALYPNVRFIFANQGETAATVTGFLKKENLYLNNVILDPDRSWMTRFHTTGIPTTLFFDANGKLLSSRVGEMSEAALDAHITRLQQAH